MNIPQELKYTKDHEWVRIESDGAAVVGITDFAQDKLGNVVYVELPAEGDTVAAGDSCATVESTKAASDVYAPLAGTVVAVNGELEDKPELLNEDPYAGGWLFKLTPADAGELDAMLDAAAYQALVESEG